MADENCSTRYDVGKFAEDIVTCVMQRRFPDWVPSEAYRTGKVFPRFQATVLHFFKIYGSDVRDECWYYFKGKDKSIENYEEFCTVMKTSASNMEFNVDKIWNIVLRIAEFGAYMYYSGCLDAPRIAIIRIGDIMQKFPHFIQKDSSKESCK